MINVGSFEAKIHLPRLLKDVEGARPLPSRGGADPSPGSCLCDMMTPARLRPRPSD